MKKTKSLWAVLLAFVMALALGACGVEIGGEETWSSSAEDREGVISLYNDFVKKTYADTNHVDTITAGGKELITETVDGTSYHAVGNDGEHEVYAFMDGAKYIYATIFGEEKEYTEDKSLYDDAFKGYTWLPIEEIPAEQVASYSAKVEGSRKGDESTETLTIELKKHEGENGTIKAVSKNGLVQQIDVTPGLDGKDTSTFSFTYGQAKVTVPDVSTWKTHMENG